MEGRIFLVLFWWIKQGVFLAGIKKMLKVIKITRKSTGCQIKKSLKIFLIHFYPYYIRNVIDQFEAFIY